MINVVASEAVLFRRHVYKRISPLCGAGLAKSEGNFIKHFRGKRIRVKKNAPAEFPFNLTPEDKKLGLDGMYRKYEGDVYKEIGDPSSPDWSFASVKKYDEITYPEFLRSRGASAEAIALMTSGWAELWGDGLDTVSALTLLRDYSLTERAFRLRSRTG